jgi:hypothetical protein
MPTIPYVKQTWTDGVSQYTAARGGVQEDGIFNVSYAPAVRVTRSAAATITTGTNTTMTFDVERFDQAGNAADTMHDNSTNPSRLTCRYAGVYLITANIRWAGNATGDRYLSLLYNNTDEIAGVHDTGDATENRQSVSTLWALAVNDYVEVRVHQTSGGNLDVTLSAKISPEFMMVRVA